MTYSIDSNFLSPVYQVTTNTSTQTSPTNPSSLVSINGTEISYTPPSSATSVIYETSFSLERINDRYFQQFRIEYYNGTSWVQFHESYQRAVGPYAHSTQAYRELRHFRWVLPAWSGSRNFRVAVGSYASSREAQYHGLSEWDGATVSSPTTVLTDTCVFVYSI